MTQWFYTKKSGGSINWSDKINQQSSGIVKIISQDFKFKNRRFYDQAN
jgi:hypothetical protein